MSPTIKDIARLTNTSRATVDRVIHKRGNVNKQLEEKILNAIKQLGYEPNYFAQALVRSSKILKIGIVISSLDSQFFKRVKNGILLNMQKNQKQFEYIILENDPLDVEKQIKNIRKIAAYDLDGIIITPIAAKQVSGELTSFTCPIITLASDITVDAKVGYIGCNYYSNGTIAADLANNLTNNGKILILVNSLANPSTYQRYHGFLESLNQSIKTKMINLDDMALVKKHINDFKPDVIYFIAYSIGKLINELNDLLLGIKIICVDEGDDVIKGLAENKIALTITQQPEKQGYKALGLLIDLFLFNKQVPKVTYIGNKIKVKHSNFDERIGEENE